MSSDEASIVSDGEIENLEIIQEVDANSENNQIDEGVTQNETAQQDLGDEDEAKKTVKPKRVIKNPQPKLNEQTLKEQRGLGAIESYFERVKFKGRGHEEQDLNVLMKTYEYWCHRLFPKFPFDNCIERLEKLGTKKATQTHIKRIRMGINLNDDKPLNDAAEEIENNTVGFVDTNDEFDNLLPTSSLSTPEISEEQLERMHQNRERAEKLRQDRLKQIMEKARSSLAETSRLKGCSLEESSQLRQEVSQSNNSKQNTQFSGNISQDNSEYQENATINVDNKIFSQNIERDHDFGKKIEKGIQEEGDIDNILEYINGDEDMTENYILGNAEYNVEIEVNNASFSSSNSCRSENIIITATEINQNVQSPLECNEIITANKTLNKNIDATSVIISSIENKKLLENSGNTVDDFREILAEEPVDDNKIAENKIDS